MTHQTRAEFDGEAHCLVKNTVGFQEAENGALLCSMEIANKPRRVFLTRQSGAAGNSPYETWVNLACSWVEASVMKI